LTIYFPLTSEDKTKQN